MPSKEPLVFVPGLMGTIGDDIIPGTGKLKFGPAGMVYNDFIDALEKMGYEKEKNLFICYYNWKKGCDYNVNQYLIKTIKTAKNKTGSPKVTVIAHSMGGLVSRCYVQTKNYQNDINKLILLGCPHSGATDAYYLWAEGKMPDRTGVKSFFFHILIEGFLMILKYFYQLDSMKDLIHEEFQSIEELLPSKFFGRYLYYLDSSDIINYILYENLKYKNHFLDQLNTQYDTYRKKGVTCYLVAGSGEVTNKSLQLSDVQFNKSGNISNSGHISEKIRSFEGDGTVLEKSALNMVGIKYVMNTSHADMLMNGIHILKDILEGDIEWKLTQQIKTKRYIGVLILGKCKIFIKINGRKYLMKSHFQMKEIHCIQCRNIHWIIYDHNKSNNIHFTYQSLQKEPIEVVLSKKNEMNHYKTSASTHSIKLFQ